MSGTEALDVLALAHALVDSGWTQGASARRKDGSRIGWSLPEARRFCLVGALEAAAWGVDRDRREALDAGDAATEGVSRCLPEATSLVEFNDAPGRRKRDVLRLLERAAAKVGKG